jgi:hypothetical protein
LVTPQVINLNNHIATVNFEIQPYVNYVFIDNIAISLIDNITVNDSVGTKTSLLKKLISTNKSTVQITIPSNTSFKAYWDNVGQWRISEDVSLPFANSIQNSGSTTPTSKVIYDLQQSLQSQIADKVTIEAGKQLSTEDYTTAEKNKLAGITQGAEPNVQSSWTEADTSSDAYIIGKPNLSIYATTTDVNTNLANKVDKVTGKQLSTNDYTTTEKAKLAGLSNYTHPVGAQLTNGLYKITTDSGGNITTGTSVIKSDITSLGIPAQDTTYTDSQSGSGNAVTNVTVVGNVITVQKSSTFVTDDRIQLVTELPVSPVANVLYLIPE